MGGMQRAVRLIYPDRCLACGGLVEGDQGLCGTCWADTPFVAGPVCDTCGTPVIGGADETDATCDDCLTIPRPWAGGRAAMLYQGRGRRIVLALKHGDRSDIAAPAARWMVRAAGPLIRPGTLVVPIPAHWLRLMARRYNQAALLAQEIARVTGAQYRPDLLLRRRRTKVQDGMTVSQRFENLGAAIGPTRRAAAMAGKPVLLIDDVMTSGATLAAAAVACQAAGAASVSVLVLARAVKAP